MERSSITPRPAKCRKKGLLNWIGINWLICSLIWFTMRGVRSDFSDTCPSTCNCKWANGKREADCTRAGFTTVPTNLDHEIQILRMTHNYVRIVEKAVFRSAGLLNLQRIFMNNCHVQVSASIFESLS